MIVVAGEALIDLIVHEDGRLEAVLGGGPFNTARTIARLGGSVAFLGRLSTDRFGGMLRDALRADGVDLRFSTTTEAPTTLAVAELDGHGAAVYRFHLAETSAPGLQPADAAPAIAASPVAIHVGTLGLVAEPIATTLEDAVTAAKLADPATLVMVDPNCRPSIIRDRRGYLDRLARVLADADIVKASTDDLAYLAPGRAPVDAATDLLLVGPAVVLLTDGGRPVRIIGRTFVAESPVPDVPVTDTVGAGDAFGGGFLARWVERGQDRDGLADAGLVTEAVDVAIEVASRTCRRAGADPPRRSEVRSLAG